MFGNAFGWPHLLIILAVILLLFGATRLPALAKSIGQSMKVFRREMKSDEPESPATGEQGSSATGEPSAPTDKK